MIVNEVLASQQIGFPILTVLTFLPFLGALLIWLFQTDEDLIRKTAVGIACLEFFVSVLLLWNFVPQSADVQFAERRLGEGDSRLDLVVFRDVGVCIDGVTTRVRDALDHGGAPLVVHVRQNHLAALFGKEHGGFGAQARRRAGDQRYLS